MARKREKVGEIHRVYFDWGEFFGKIFVIVLGLVLLASVLGYGGWA